MELWMYFTLSHTTDCNVILKLISEIQSLLCKWQRYPFFFFTKISVRLKIWYFTTVDNAEHTFVPVADLVTFYLILKSGTCCVWSPNNSHAIWAYQTHASERTATLHVHVFAEGQPLCVIITDTVTHFQVGLQSLLVPYNIQHFSLANRHFDGCMCERPPLWSSGQSSWLEIRRPGFDFRHYEKRKVVGLERGPLSLVSRTEEPLDTKVAAPV
jgi:hypothetical protein